MDMHPIVEAMTRNWGWTLIAIVALFWITAATIEAIAKNRSREQTRRELAAYIAEGSMTPEQADRVMRGGKFSVDVAAGGRAAKCSATIGDDGS